MLPLSHYCSCPTHSPTPSITPGHQRSPPSCPAHKNVTASLLTSRGQALAHIPLSPTPSHWCPRWRLPLSPPTQWQAFSLKVSITHLVAWGFVGLGGWAALSEHVQTVQQQCKALLGKVGCWMGHRFKSETSSHPSWSVNSRRECGRAA